MDRADEYDYHFRNEVMNRIEPLRNTKTSVEKLLFQCGYHYITPRQYYHWVERRGETDRVHESVLYKKRVQICNCILRYFILSPSYFGNGFTELADELRTKVKDGSFHSIRKQYLKRKKEGINNHEGDENIPGLIFLRSQTNIYYDQPKDLRKNDDDLYVKIYSQLAPLMPNHKLEDLKILESEPGLTKQDPHTDYGVKEENVCSNCQFKQQGAMDSLDQYSNQLNRSFSFVIALEENTPLYFYYEDHKQRYKRFSSRTDRIVLNKYEGVIWEASTIHSGAEYEVHNCRIFGKFVGTEVPNQEDQFSWSNVKEE
jgi:hypothetical protein